MVLEALTTEELIRYIDGNEPTERELVLLDRLRNALDEVEELHGMVVSCGDASAAADADA